MIKTFFVWILGCLGFFGLSFGLGSLGIPAWPTILILLLAGAALSWLPKLTVYQRISAIFVYSSLFLLLWLQTNSYGPKGTTFDLLYKATTLSATAVFAFSALVFLAAITKKSPGRKTMIALLPLFFLGWLIAFFSGDAGGPDPMMRLFLSMGFSEGLAELAVVVCRKTIHFVFYGLFAAFAYRAAAVSEADKKAALWFAFTYPLLHAVFDETRQLFSTGRTGSVWDVLLDLTGMAFFLWVVGVFRPQQTKA